MSKDDYGIISKCHSFQVRANKVLAQHGRCEDAGFVRRALWYAFSLGQFLEFAGFASAAFATFRRDIWTTMTPTVSQTYALRFALLAVLLRIAVDLVLLGGFDVVVAPAVGMDDERVFLAV